MIILSQEQLRELLNEAWEDGFTESMMRGGVCANDKADERDRDIAELLKAHQFPAMVYAVDEFTSVPDSIWSSKELAEKQVVALDASNGGEFASYCAYQLNEPDGYKG